MRKLMTATIACALLVPATLVAQGPGGRGWRSAPDRAQDRAPRMERRGLGPAQGPFTPHMLLRQRERLDLTDDQVARLETLATEMRTAHEAAADATEPRVERLRELWRADQPDVGAIQAEMRAIASARQEAGLGRIPGLARAVRLLRERRRLRPHLLVQARGPLRPEDRSCARAAS